MMSKQVETSPHNVTSPKHCRETKTITTTTNIITKNDKKIFKIISDKYKELLNGTDTTTRETLLNQAYDLFYKISDKCYYQDTNLFFINEDNNIIQVKTLTDFRNLCTLNFNMSYIVGNREINIFDIKKLKTLLLYKEVINIKYKVNLFEDKNLITFNKNSQNKYDLIYTISKLNIKNKSFFNEITKKEYDLIVKDYNEHFKDLNLFLDFIVANLFTENRKMSYLNLHTKSNWGKSFLSAILKEIGAGYEMNQSSFREDKPVGINPNDIISTFILIIDEFKYFSKEMKKISNSMFIEPKFKNRIEVEVFSKILLNAETSESFINGVDTQIQNRIIQISYVDNKIKELTKRNLYNELGNFKYKNVIMDYIFKEIKKRVDKYLSFGKVEADKVAEQTLKEISQAKKLKVENLEDKILSIIIDFLQEHKDNNFNEDMNYKIKEILSNIIYKDNFIYIKAPQKTIMNIIQETTTKEFYAKAKYKNNSLEEILSYKTKIEAKTHKINNKAIKAIKINLNELKRKYLSKTKQITLSNDIDITFNDINELTTKINETIKDLIENDKNPNIIIEDLKGIDEILEENLIMTKQNNKLLAVELKT